MNSQKHTCKFERIPLDLTPTLISPEIRMVERHITALELLFKGQKKSKNVKQCKVCGKYSIECPYCKNKIVSIDYPLKMVCPNCKKEFQVRWNE